MPRIYQTDRPAAAPACTFPRTAILVSLRHRFDSYEWNAWDVVTRTLGFRHKRKLGWDNNDGIFVTVGNVIGDDHAEIIVATDGRNPARTRVFDGTSGGLIAHNVIAVVGFTSGTRVAAVDADDDSAVELLYANGADLNVYRVNALTEQVLGQFQGTVANNGIFIAAGAGTGPAVPVIQAPDDRAPPTGADSAIIEFTAFGPTTTPFLPTKTVETILSPANPVVLPTAKVVSHVGAQSANGLINCYDANGMT